MQPALLGGRCCRFLHSTVAAVACCTAIIDVYSLILPPQTYHTDPPACLQSCKELFICCEMAHIRVLTHTQTHVRLWHTHTMDSLMDDPLMPFLHTKSILFIWVQSPTPPSHHWHSAPSMSLCLCTLVYLLVSRHQLWIRSQWVNL